METLRAREALVTQVALISIILLSLCSCLRLMQDSHEGRTRLLNTGGDGTMVENQESSSPQGLLYMSRSLDEMNVSKRLYKFKGLVLTYLLKIYFILLLNLPKFYASRIYLWARSADPAVSETCPSRRNSANSILWLTFDERLDCDVDFCDRVLTALLREWKTLRVLSSIVFASVLAMLQIDRVEQDAVISTPAYSPC
ncbi:hypothetical protein AN958_00693 [Leucoagaricus sp. SymC.cos]|nr:hypothetical protein AN958_00693 [Leucoagaricus sp. SymC.cos]